MIFKPREAGGLSYVLVPENFSIENYPYDPNKVEAWEHVHDHDAVQMYIKTRNLQHFGQAHRTPFTVDPRNKINWQADSIEANEILSGVVPMQFISDNSCVNNVLQYLANQKNLPEIDTYITPDQVAKGFKRWRETTSTSPSGCHLGLRRITSYPCNDVITDEI
jgi:hypothetical protein